MIFLGHPIKLISPSYTNRFALMEMRERKSLAEFLDDIWEMRDREQLAPMAPQANPIWKAEADARKQAQTASEAVVPMKRGAGR